jgi:hypothetical protein
VEFVCCELAEKLYLKNEKVGREDDGWEDFMVEATEEKCQNFRVNNGSTKTSNGK